MLSAWSWTFIPKLAFEYDLSELRPNGLAYDELSEAERSVAKKAFQPLVVSVQSEEDLLTVHNHAAQIVATHQTPYLQGVVSIYSILPSDQGDRVALLQAIQQLNQHPNIVYLPVGIQKNLQVLTKEKIEVIQKSDLPREIQGPLGASLNTHRLMLLPNGNMWDI